MEIDKFIAELTKLRQTYGPGLTVMQLSAFGGGLKKATLPRIAHTKKDNPRALFSVSHRFDRDKGDRVVVLGIPDEMARAERKATAK